MKRKLPITLLLFVMISLLSGFFLTADASNKLCTITILGKTYTVANNMDDKTLKKYVGWDPHSVKPGENGQCVLLAHRDKQFKILSRVRIGNKITIKQGKKKFVYIVKNIQIFPKKSDLCFDSEDGKLLSLITCYPFRYKGHAPGFYLVTCVLQ